MDTASSTQPITTLLILVVAALYAAVYYTAKWITVRTSDCGPDAGLPRWVGLAAMLATACVTAIWMRASFVDPAVYASLDPFMQGQYLGMAMGPAVIPAFFASPVILVKIWRARKRRQEREQAERARYRPSPKW